MATQQNLHYDKCGSLQSRVSRSIPVKRVQFAEMSSNQETKHFSFLSIHLVWLAVFEMRYDSD